MDFVLHEPSGAGFPEVSGEAVGGVKASNEVNSNAKVQKIPFCSRCKHLSVTHRGSSVLDLVDLLTQTEDPRA